MRQSNTALDWLGHKLARVLLRETPGQEDFIPSDPDALRRTLRPGDVILVAGSSRIATAVKYLTRSTWSHAALYVGDVLGAPDDGSERHTLIEVVLDAGCRSAPLSSLTRFHAHLPAGRADRQRSR